MGANGTSICTPANKVTAVATTNCAIQAQAISITNFCPANPVPQGGLMTLTGTVCNVGNALVTNVVVTNVVSGIGAFYELGPVALGIGECQGFTVSFTVPLNFTDCPLVATASASGTSACNPADKVSKSSTANYIRPVWE